MLQPFKYGGQSFKSPKGTDLSGLDLESGTSLGGMSDALKGITDMFSEGGGEAALGSEEGGKLGGMGDIASLAAAEETNDVASLPSGVEDDNSGWMTRMFGDEKDDSGYKKAMTNPWTALAAVTFKKMFNQ